MQCKDIPELPVLQFLASLNRWATRFSGLDNSIQQAMPAQTPDKLVRAKMASLIRRKLVDGCICGCRGDYELTPAGQINLAARTTTLALPTTDAPAVTATTA